MLGSGRTCDLSLRSGLNSPSITTAGDTLHTPQNTHTPSLPVWRIAKRPGAIPQSCWHPALPASQGTGGFGVVHKGRIKHSNDTIAVKICLCQDSDMVASFKREVKMLSSLRHEHIVLFRGACVDLPHLCIVTELMSQGNLYNLLHDEDMDMPWKLRVRWVRDIARGLPKRAAGGRAG